MKNTNLYSPVPFTFAFLMLSAALVAEPVVSDVRVEQDANTRMVTLTYDLSEAAAGRQIELFGDGKLITRSGNWVGEKAFMKYQAGDDIKGYWRPPADDFTVSRQLTARVRVWPKDNPPPYLELDFATTNTTYYFSTNDLPYPVASDYYRTQAMLFRRIPAKGVTYWMGNPAEIKTHANTDYHKVTLTNDFYIGVFPVTQAQWQWGKSAANANPSLQQDRSDSPSCPMDNVSYYDIVNLVNTEALPAGYWYAGSHWQYANSWLNKFQARSKLKNVGIPTEAQWEYACRAGSGDFTYDSSATDDELSWNWQNADGRTHPVGLKKPNAWGLYDMLGNIWELCLDQYVDNLGTAEVTMPYATGTHCYKTCRGGGYDSYAGDCYSARRTVLAGHYDWGSASRKPNGGFRVLLGIH